MKYKDEKSFDEILKDAQEALNSIGKFRYETIIHREGPRTWFETKTYKLVESGSK